MEKKGFVWKWIFELIFNEYKIIKVKCEFCYGIIFGYLEKVWYKDKGIFYWGLCIVILIFIDLYFD